MTTSYKSIMTTYNLSGLAGTSKVPYLPTYGTDSEGNIYITYTFFRNSSDVANSDHYDALDEEATDLSSNYDQDLENVIFDILNDGAYWSASLDNAIKINFVQPATINSTDTGIITFGQLTNQFSLFDDPNEESRSAVTYEYQPQSVPESDQMSAQLHGDIWFNMNHNDSINRNTWADFGDIEKGTSGYKVIYEEILHALGIDFIYNINGVPTLLLPENEATQKYTITSYAPYGQIVPNGTTSVVTDSDPV